MTDKLNHLKKLSIYGFGQLFNLVTPLLVAPYIISICGEENFGKAAVGMALSFFLMVFIDYGSDVIGVRAISIHRNLNGKLNELFNITFSVKSLTLLLVSVVYILVIVTLPYFSQEKLLFLLGITVLIGQWLNPTWFLQGLEEIKWITYLNIISKCCYLLTIFLFVKQANDYIWINFFWGIGMILAHLIVIILIMRKYNIKIKLINLSTVIKHIQNDFSFFSSQIFVSLQLYAPVFLVSFFGNNILAGQFRIIEQIIVILRTYILLFFNFIFPKVCFEMSNDLKKGFKNWILYNGINFIFIVFLTFLIYWFSDLIIFYFNPNKSVHIGQILRNALCLPLLLGVSIPLKQLILAFNYNQFYIYITSIVILLMLLAIVFILPYYQINGVFYSLIVAEMVLIIFYLYKLKKKLNFHD